MLVAKCEPLASISMRGSENQGSQTSGKSSLHQDPEAFVPGILLIWYLSTNYMPGTGIQAKNPCPPRVGKDDPGPGAAAMKLNERSLAFYATCDAPGCTVELVEAAEEFAFAVRFAGARARTYVLAAESQAAMEGWTPAGMTGPREDLMPGRRCRVSPGPGGSDWTWTWAETEKPWPSCTTPGFDLLLLQGLAPGYLPVPRSRYLTSPYTNLVMEKFLLLVPISKVVASKMKLFKNRKMINCLIKPNSKSAFSDEDFLKERSELPRLCLTALGAAAVLTRSSSGNTWGLGRHRTPFIVQGDVLVVSVVVGREPKAEQPGFPDCNSLTAETSSVIGREPDKVVHGSASFKYNRISVFKRLYAKCLIKSHHTKARFSPLRSVVCREGKMAAAVLLRKASGETSWAVAMVQNGE
ncbi:hypothetical protein PANDA_000878 [Ailuropoda melanoleuca]|uniref:Uncharacterized protein n=1 Tax=Ailuropoda melanoleuca TaxID=9646 RepID=D2GVU8_AILME|nr:hypothetical protein PANDA_000878 [Ailuropoda melanoleuca]